jgi:hypothetical protein
MKWEILISIMIFMHVKAIEEKTKCGWSPLYGALKKHPLKKGLPCPWVHTKEEL